MGGYAMNVHLLAAVCCKTDRWSVLYSDDHTSHLDFGPELEMDV